MQTNLFVLQSTNGCYFRMCPLRPMLMKQVSEARLFENEALAEVFRDFVESTAQRSFAIVSVKQS